jgi:hypothetical protein
MTFDIRILIPFAIWAGAALVVAAMLYARHRKRPPGEPFPSRIAWLIGGVLALGGSAVTTSILYVITSDDGSGDLWGGVPLILLSLGLFWRAWRGDRKQAPAVTTFREKSTAITIIAMLLVYGWATFVVFRAPLELPVVFGMLVATSVLMTVLMTASHIVLAIVRPPEKEDERDKLVGWRSSRNGYVVMLVGVWGLMAGVLFGAPPALIAYGLIQLFVLAELIRLVSELIYFRLDI